MKKIVFATHNDHKLKEIRNILKGNYEVLGLKDIGFFDEVDETGTTLHENASIKSRTIYEKYNIDCFSDDTGLLVDALDGAPGVYSARYAGEEANANNNIIKLLSRLEGSENRRAHFSTVISLIIGGKEYFFEGKVFGNIIESKSGEGGFGYDPVFIPDGYKTTFAEMSPELKNSISHRGIAVTKLSVFLNDFKF